jgi:hypothetical protein
MYLCGNLIEEWGNEEVVVTRDTTLYTQLSSEFTECPALEDIHCSTVRAGPVKSRVVSLVVTQSVSQLSYVDH